MEQALQHTWYRYGAQACMKYLCALRKDYISGCHCRLGFLFVPDARGIHEEVEKDIFFPFDVREQESPSSEACQRGFGNYRGKSGCNGRVKSVTPGGEYFCGSSCGQGVS